MIANFSFRSFFSSPNLCLPPLSALSTLFIPFFPSAPSFSLAKQKIFLYKFLHLFFYFSSCVVECSIDKIGDCKILFLIFKSILTKKIKKKLFPPKMPMMILVSPSREKHTQENIVIRLRVF